ncbi:MAG: hypothetical protein H7346_07250 [Burkholderiaceae bacterium]|nr:hypothetical protein [Burkholderiaceae bacterium]
MSSITLYRPAAAAARWWAPLEATRPNSAARGPAPSAVQRAAEQAAALAAIRAIEITHPREALASAGQALQRALNRGDAAAEGLALQHALAAAHAQTRQTDEVLAAAWSLLSLGACALPRARERHQALALAAAAWGASGRPCMVLAADDEGAATAARAGSTVLADLGLQSALAPSDAAGAALREAYAADVVYVPARRLAADLARDRRERGGGDATRLESQLAQHGETPLLTSGLFTVLIDEADRVLFDDAVNPVVLSVADDPTALGRAIASACLAADGLQPTVHYEVDLRHGLLWTAEGAVAATVASALLPPLWRAPERAELLLTQAIAVRDLLEKGRDYTVLANGQVHIDEGVIARLPDRALLANLTQALQARLGVEQSPITRATDRSSVLSLVAGAHRLGAVAATLDGLAAPLWARHGLKVDGLAQPQEPWPVKTELLADDAAWRERLQDLFLNGPTDLLRVYVLRQITDAARFAALPGAQGQPWVLASLGPARTLAALANAPRETALQSIELVFTEPLDSARAEAAFLCRAADASGLPVSGRFLLQAQARWCRDALGLFARPARALATPWPTGRRLVLQTALGLLRWRAARHQQLSLAAVAQREQQLRQQLSFTGQAPTAVQTRPALPGA